MGSDEARVLRYGIIGVGMMGREHLYNLAALPGAMVVAVADPHPGSREAALAATAGLQSVVPSPPLTVSAPPSPSPSPHLPTSALNTIHHHIVLRACVSACRSSRTTARC
jgi:hypothetical protein